jgi:hypothetical protein
VIKKLFLGFVTALLLLVVSVYVMHTQLINYIYFKKINAISKQYNIKLLSDSITLNGISNVTLRSFYVVPTTTTDTLLGANNLTISIDVKALLLSRKISITNVAFTTINASLINNGATTNYDFLLRKNPKDSLKLNSKTPYNEKVANLLNKLFDLLPNNLQAQHLQVSYAHPKLKLGYTMDTLKIINGKIVGVLNEDFSGNTWSINGAIDKYNKRVNATITSNTHNREVYTIEKLSHVKCMFKSLTFSLNNFTINNQTTTLNCNATINDFSVEHYRLSTTPITLSSASIQAQLNISANGFMLDSASTAIINNLTIKPYAQLTMRPVKQYELDVNIPLTNATKVIQALPSGICNSFMGMQLNGLLGYAIHFKLNTALPDSCEFKSKVLANNVSISKMGAIDFSKINGAFTHTIYEKENLMRTMVIGPSNPNFYALANISPYVQYAILTSEDGSFMWHKGFNEGAIRKSIAQNYKEGRFARGGSTISMQLVKNIFLNRNKTLSRKVEEAFIVWTIENLHLSNKQRMYEVYLNSIEFGPNVYGIGEACQFYFAKKPNEISLSEALFLSTIVPKPKAFMYYFDAQGKLNTYLEPHFQYIARILFWKKYITENEMNDAHANITIAGAAKRYLKTTTDTLNNQRTFNELWESLLK